MEYVAPVGAGDPNDPYVDANLPSVLGSRVPAAAIEHVMREIVALIVLSGQTPSGGNLAQLYAGVLAMIRNQVNNYTRQQYFAIATLTDAASIAWNLNTQQVAKVVLGGNRTLANPTNMQNGGPYRLHVIQDGTGGRTLSFGSSYVFPNDSAPVVASGPGERTVLDFTVDQVGATKYMFGAEAGPYSL